MKIEFSTTVLFQGKSHSSISACDKMDFKDLKSQSNAVFGEDGHQECKWN